MQQKCADGSFIICADAGGEKWTNNSGWRDMNLTYFEDLSEKYFNGELFSVPSANYSCPADIYGSNDNVTYLPGTFLNNIVYLALSGLICTHLLVFTLSYLMCILQFTLINCTLHLRFTLIYMCRINKIISSPSNP